MNTLICLNCGHEIRHGDIDAMEDEYGYYCNDICADEYYEQKHGLDSIDWDDFDQKQKCDAETRDNYFNAYVIAPCFVTNGRFAIYGDIKITDAHAKGFYSSEHEANKIKWLDQYEYWTHDKEDAIRVALDYYASGRRVAVCEETTTIKKLFTMQGMTP